VPLYYYFILGFIFTINEVHMQFYYVLISLLISKVHFIYIKNFLNRKYNLLFYFIKIKPLNKY